MEAGLFKKEDMVRKCEYFIKFHGKSSPITNKTSFIIFKDNFKLTNKH